MHDVSVLLATRDRPDILQRTLESFCALDTPSSHWQLLVIDDSRSGSALGVARRFDSRIPLRCLQRPEVGKNAALNYGLTHTDPTLLCVFTDDDVRPRSDWLNQLMDGARRWPQHDVFGGKVLPIFPCAPPPEIDLEWWRVRDAYVIAEWPFPEGPYQAARVWGPNMAIRSEVFRKGVRFDERRGPNGTNYAMGGETELTERLAQGGPPPVYLPNAVVHHEIREEQLTVKWLRGRAFRAGRAEALNGPPSGMLGLYRTAAKSYLRARWPTDNRRRALTHWMEFELARGNIFQRRINSGDSSRRAFLPSQEDPGETS